jgi:hypothetical protein
MRLRKTFQLVHLKTILFALSSMGLILNLSVRTGVVLDRARGRAGRDEHKKKTISLGMVFSVMVLWRLGCAPRLLYQVGPRRFDRGRPVQASAARYHRRFRSESRPTGLADERKELSTKKDHLFGDGLFCNSIVATTYFTRFDPSIIGGSGLNFSVRDGKR